jgi:hypothetical protein
MFMSRHQTADDVANLKYLGINKSCVHEEIKSRDRSDI